MDHFTAFMKELNQENVVVGDRDELENKIKNLVSDGANKLLVLADFDSTLTKSFVDGMPTAHSLEIFARTKSLSAAYRDGCTALYEKYDAKVSSSSLSPSQKQEILDKWWAEHEELTIGEAVTLADVIEAVDAANTPLRDGCVEMLSLLSDHQVPLVVISAGLGEVVDYCLQDFKPAVVSNYLINDENGRVLGFTKPTVSVYNKHNMLLPVQEDRPNVIVLGDSLGDAKMADNISDLKTVLKIGFLSDTDEKKLETYRSCYDIVLVNDQTMYTVTALLKLIISVSQDPERTS